MSKIKPVKAWGIIKSNGKIDDGWVYRTKQDAAGDFMRDEKLIRVEIRPVTPKKKVRK